MVDGLTGRKVGLNGAKSVSKSQCPLVTSTFSLLISPWHTPLSWLCETALISKYTNHRFSMSVRNGRVDKRSLRVPKRCWRRR